MTEYDPATHIFNYARNSAPHYRKMLRLHELRNDAFAPGRVAMDARGLASEVVRDMRKRGEMEALTVRAVHILRAAVMFMEWDGEE